MLALLAGREPHPHLPLIAGLAHRHTRQVAAVWRGHVTRHLAGQLSDSAAAGAELRNYAGGVHHKGGRAVDEGVRGEVFDLDLGEVDVGLDVHFDGALWQLATVVFDAEKISCIVSAVNTMRSLIRKITVTY